MHFHPNSNNIEDVARSPIRSTMSPRESKEIATHRDYCTTKLRVTVSSTPPRLYALKSSILDYRSYLENKIKVVIRRGKEKKVIANQRHNLLTDSLLFLSLLFFPLSTLLLYQTLLDRIKTFSLQASFKNPQQDARFLTNKGDLFDWRARHAIRLSLLLFRVRVPGSVVGLRGPLDFREEIADIFEIPFRRGP